MAKTNPPTKKTTGGKATAPKKTAKASTSKVTKKTTPKKATAKKATSRKVVKKETDEEDPDRPRERLVGLTAVQAYELLKRYPAKDRWKLLDGYAKGCNKDMHGTYNIDAPPTETDTVVESLGLKKSAYDRKGDYPQEVNNNYSAPRHHNLEGFPIRLDSIIIKERLWLGKSKEPAKKKTTEKATEKATTPDGGEDPDKKPEEPEEEDEESVEDMREALRLRIEQELAEALEEYNAAIDTYSTLAAADRLNEVSQAVKELVDKDEQEIRQQFSLALAVGHQEIDTIDAERRAQKADPAAAAAAAARRKAAAEAGHEPRAPRNNAYGQITAALKYEVVYACGKFDIGREDRPSANYRPTDDADTEQRKKWQKMLRYMAAHSQFIPDAIKIALCTGSSILRPDENFNNPTIAFENEVWTQERRFFWHALDCLCHELFRSRNESLNNATTQRDEWEAAENTDPNHPSWFKASTDAVTAAKEQLATNKNLYGLCESNYQVPWAGYPYFNHPHPDWDWTLVEANRRLEADEEEERKQRVARMVQAKAAQKKTNTVEPEKKTDAVEPKDTTMSGTDDGEKTAEEKKDEDINMGEA